MSLRKDKNQNILTDPSSESLAGTARLSAVTAAALITFLLQTLLIYLLPLYFPARNLPTSAWETWGTYGIISWLIVPVFAGMLAKRIGERSVWALGLLVNAVVIVWLIFLPARQMGTDFIVGIAAMASGVSAALVWISGMSLVQNVTDSKRGRSNSLFLISVGIGSIAGPVIGRLMLAAFKTGNSSSLTGFLVILWIGALLSLAGSLIVYFWGEYPHPLGTLRPERVIPTFMDDLRLFRSPRFLVMIIPIGLLAGPVFQAANVYVAYRAKEPNIGLILHSQDHGWIALQITGYIMQLLGGLLVGRIAGKKVAYYVAAGLLAAYALCVIGIGLAPGAIILIFFVALFEIFRQFARWMQTGYISEHVPSNQRSAAIGATVMISGLGGTTFMFLSRHLQSPDSPNFSSTIPFLIAGSLALLGVVILLAGGYRLLRTEPDGSGDIKAPAKLN